MNNKDYKIIAVIALCIGIVALSIAFAAMSSTLKIRATTRYGGNEWNIHFANIDEGSTTGLAEKGKVRLKSTTITISDVVLHKPGDTVTYTFDIVNSGLIDAKVESIADLIPVFIGTGENKIDDEKIVKDNFYYSLTYVDGTPITNGNTLLSGASKRVKLTIGYKANVDAISKDVVIVSNIGTTLIYNEK